MKSLFTLTYPMNVLDDRVLVGSVTGTGKEVIASPRLQNRFAAPNCAAIPNALLESGHFGHERGAFTGTVAQTVGRFQAALRPSVLAGIQ
jgi:transcriptional regulator with GAF, ATPase, and Fis domain